jgi:signal transduction histidine kinase
MLLMTQTEQVLPNVDMHSSNSLPLSSAGSSLGELAHDARNIVAALGVYCDLLEEPGVFAEPYRHYGSELRTVANASCRLVDKLIAQCGRETSTFAPAASSGVADHSQEWPAPVLEQSKAAQYWSEIPPTPIQNFAWELQTNRHLLAALAGPSVTFTIDAADGALPVRLSGEDLTRILVNLIKNSVEAMPGSGGRIQLILRECQSGPADQITLLLNIEDNGQGIAPGSLERVFERGYTTRSNGDDSGGKNQGPHRGLGLSITRSIVEAAGGCIRAANRDPIGACIQIELPALRDK